MTAKSDFMAAEEIKAILNGRDKPEQERIVRWVNESLGLVAPANRPVASNPSAPIPAAPHDPSTTASVGVGRPVDIKSFIAEKKPKSDVQFAAVAAYFYSYNANQAERKESITAKDLQEAGRQARGVGFKKPIATLSNGLKLGYFN